MRILPLISYFSVFLLSFFLNKEVYNQLTNIYAKNICNTCNSKPLNSGVELIRLKNINIIYHNNSINAYPR